MTTKYFHISSLCLLALIFIRATQIKNIDNTYRLINTTDTYFAGENINLQFSYTSKSDALLFVSSSYGSTVIQPIVNANTIEFEIPNSISKKSGILNWKLLNNSDEITGQLVIKPQTKINTIESYLGPPSIEAGGTDFTMLVVIPTDMYDNALNDSTEVKIKHQFLDRRVTDHVFTNHGIAYKNIYSYSKSGRILINSESLDLNSKEYDVNIMPAIPTDFLINSERIHEYADGNQIATLKTSLIKDKFNNIVSDGTFVTFNITNQNGYRTKAFGSTINGIATAKILHPDQQDQWSIKAYIDGMANSNIIKVNFKQAISNFNCDFSDDKRTISVGPLKSFMDQKVPDGLLVSLKIFQDSKLVNEISERSFEGYATFKLNEDRYPDDNYTYVIETAGLIKTYSKTKDE